MSDDLRLIVNGTAYGGWKSVTVTRSIEALAGAFSLAVSDRWASNSAPRRIEPGDACAIEVDGARIVTGHVDAREVSHDAETRTVTIRGRDRAGDLIDCSAIVTPGVWRNAALESVVSDLCRPFNVGVVVAASTGKRFETFTVQEGESVFEALSRLAAARKLILMSDGLGSIVVTQAGARSVAYALRLGDNVLAATSARDWTDRFGEYVVKGQNPGTDYLTGERIVAARGSARDADIQRYRPYMVHSEVPGHRDALSKRAAFERDRRRARAESESVVVAGWRHPGGLWEPNIRVEFDDDVLGVRATRLVATVEFRRDDAGTTTTLGLSDPTAYAEAAT